MFVRCFRWFVCIYKLFAFFLFIVYVLDLWCLVLIFCFVGYCVDYLCFSLFGCFLIVIAGFWC